MPGATLTISLPGQWLASTILALMILAFPSARKFRPPLVLSSTEILLFHHFPRPKPRLFAPCTILANPSNDVSQYRPRCRFKRCSTKYPYTGGSLSIVSESIVNIWSSLSSPRHHRQDTPPPGRQPYLAMEFQSRPLVID